MNLLSDVVFHADPRLFLWKPRGVLNEEAVNKIVLLLQEREREALQPFQRFADLTELDAVDLNFKYVFDVALYRRLTYAGRPTTKSAFFVRNPEAEHFVKLHRMLNDYSPLRVALFEEREAAARWLGVPCGILEMP